MGLASVVPSVLLILVPVAAIVLVVLLAGAYRHSRVATTTSINTTALYVPGVGWRLTYGIS